MKFAEREERRGNGYDIVLFDPPAYGRGPKGEVWQLFEDLPRLTALCRAILSPKPLAVVLTAYSIRASFFSIHAPQAATPFCWRAARSASLNVSQPERSRAAVLPVKTARNFFMVGTSVRRFAPKMHPACRVIPASLVRAW